MQAINDRFFILQVFERRLSVQSDFTGSLPGKGKVKIMIFIAEANV